MSRLGSAQGIALCRTSSVVRHGRRWRGPSVDGRAPPKTPDSYLAIAPRRVGHASWRTTNSPTRVFARVISTEWGSLHWWCEEFHLHRRRVHYTPKFRLLVSMLPAISFLTSVPLPQTSWVRRRAKAAGLSLLLRGLPGIFSGPPVTVHFASSRGRVGMPRSNVQTHSITEYIQAIEQSPSAVRITYDPTVNPVPSYPGEYNVAVPGHSELNTASSS